MNAGLGNAGVRASKTPQAPAATVTAANNGTSLSGTTVQLGGPVATPSLLLNARYIDANTLFLNITGTANGVLRVANTDAGNVTAISASSVGGAAVTAFSTNNSAIAGQSTNGKGGAFQSATGNGLEAVSTAAASSAGTFILLPATTNTVRAVLEVSRLTTGLAANGIGGSIAFNTSTTVGGKESNSIISKWTNATDATRVSQLIITGVDNAVTADLLTISGSGATRLNKYGVGTFAGVPAFTLQVDANGNIIEGAAAGGGWGTTGTVATLTGNASIDLATNTFGIVDTAAKQLFIDPAGTYQLGDIDAALNGTFFQVKDNTREFKMLLGADPFFILNALNGSFTIGDFNGTSTGAVIDVSGPSSQFVFFDNNGNYLEIKPAPINLYRLGDIGAVNNGSTLKIDDATEIFTMTSGGGTTVGGVTTNAPSANGAGLWLLGKVNVAAVALDATQSIEAMIDGVLYKLALAV